MPGIPATDTASLSESPVVNTGFGDGLQNRKYGFEFRWATQSPVYDTACKTKLSFEGVNVALH